MPNDAIDGARGDGDVLHNFHVGTIDEHQLACKKPNNQWMSTISVARHHNSQKAHLVNENNEMALDSTGRTNCINKTSSDNFMRFLLASFRL